MKRVIKDFRSVEKHHLDLIAQCYPEGFDSEDIISILNPKGKFIRCLEVKTDECTFMFKIDEDMVEKLDEYTGDQFEIGDIEDVYNEEY
ncbi:MAG: hypothetical protein HKN32_06220 [Flavobacteriales bacterium]|nr:hypothetical protein [Flavobacteriales bacterium]